MTLGRGSSQPRSSSLGCHHGFSLTADHSSIVAPKRSSPSLPPSRPAWIIPAWIFRRATMSPPREETRRCTVMGPPGWGGRDRARRAPRSRERRSPGMGQAQGAQQASVVAEDGHQRSFHAQRDPLPSQRRTDADLLIGQADQAGGVDGAVHLDHCPIPRWAVVRDLRDVLRWRPAGPGPRPRAWRAES